MDQPSTIGTYQIRGTLGQGAMGVVHDGWDPRIGRRVAIKTVKLPHEPDPQTEEEIARFRREAQAAGSLSHPNIVTVYDYGETAELAYIVMEYVDGPTLKALLDKQERFAIPAIAAIMEQLLAGLQFSHARGIVHRDIKPANVMLTLERQVKIADFGIARIEQSSMTQVGTMMGTPPYMSPEQFLAETVDARTDVYSAGVVLYQLLTGERPFEGTLSTIMQKVLNTEPLAPSRLSVVVPPAFDAVVARAMAKRPADRYASAAEFAAAIRAAASAPATAAVPADDEGTVVARPAAPRRADPPSTPPAPPTPARGRGGVLAVAAVAVVAVLAGGGWFLFGRQTDMPPETHVVTNPPPETHVATNPPPETHVATNPPPPDTHVVTNPPPETHVVTNPPPPDTHVVTNPPPQTHVVTDPPPPETHVATNPPPPETHLVTNPPPETHVATNPPPPDTHVVANPPPETHVATNPPPETHVATNPPPETHVATNPPPPETHVVTNPPPPETHVVTNPPPPETHVVTNPPPPETHVVTNPPPETHIASIAVSAATLRRQVGGALQQARCALVDARVPDEGPVELAGLAIDPKALSESVRQSIGSARDVAQTGLAPVTSPNFCRALDLLHGLAAQPVTAPAIMMTTTLHEDEFIQPRLTMPDFAGSLRVDDLFSDGTLQHLYPPVATAKKSTPLSPHAELALGLKGKGATWQVGPPFGTDMIIAVASSQPLDVAPKSDVEDSIDATAGYLSQLDHAITAAQRAGASVSGTALPVHTLPKK